MVGAPIGVLALQGDVREHRRSLERLGRVVVEVKTPSDLEKVGGIVLPGGESTAISLLLNSSGLTEPLTRAIAGGLPTFGTCAGLVLLANSILDGRPDQVQLHGLDVVVRRNGYGRQLASFEGIVVGHGPLEGASLPAVFIRAPIIESIGDGVEVLGTVTHADAETPTLVRRGSVLASSFHPELTSDDRIHHLFCAMVEAAAE